MKETVNPLFFNVLCNLFEDVTGKRLSITDYTYTNQMLELLAKQPIGVNDLEEYVLENRPNIKMALLRLPIAEPATILAMYYIEYYERFIQNEWPRSSSEHDEIRYALGLANPD